MKGIIIALVLVFSVGSVFTASAAPSCKSELKPYPFGGGSKTYLCCATWSGDVWCPWYPER